MRHEPHEAPRRLPPPDRDAEPEKVNVFRMLRSANTELAPLFAGFEPGSIVPAAALMYGHDDGDYGRFFHRNSEEEVVVCWSARDDFFEPGVLAVNGKMHEVKAMLADASNPQTFMLSTITQRQAATGAQRESLIFRCNSCNQKLYQHDFDASPVPPAVDGDGDGDAYPAFASIPESLAAAVGFNESVASVPCPSCGAPAPEFPIHRWGWREWTTRNELVNEARRRLDAAAAKHLAGTEGNPS